MDEPTLPVLLVQGNAVEDDYGYTAGIFGTREALTALRDAIDRVLAMDQPVAVERVWFSCHGQRFDCAIALDPQTNAWLASPLATPP